MRILVTGARGMLGVDLCEVLSRQNEVTGVDIEDADITSTSEARKLVENVSPEAVVHCAAYTDVDRSESESEKAFRVNAEGARNVALACAQGGAALVYISTDYVFDGRLNRPYTELDEPSPLGVYGASKLEGEKVIRSLVSNSFVIRTSWLFGPHGRNFVDTIIRLGQDRDTIEVVDDQIGCPTFTKDLCAALATVVGSDKFGIYHVSNSGSCSWFGFAEEILRAQGASRARVVPIKSAQLKRPAARPAMSVLDTSKFRRTFGFAMRDWREALAEHLGRQRAGNPE